MDIIKRLFRRVDENETEKDVEDNTVVQVISSNKDDTQKENDLPFGADSQQVAPGIYVPKKKKKSKKAKIKRNLDGVYQKTANNLTPPSYLCSTVTIACGFVCFAAGIAMVIAINVTPNVQSNRVAFNFMRVGGGMFIIIGAVIMLSGFFYFLLVYLRHKGYFDRKEDRKPIHDNNESEYEDEKETNVDHWPARLPSIQSSVTSDAGIVFNTRSESKFAGRRGSVFSSQRSVLPSIPSNEALNEATLKDHQSKHLQNRFQASNHMKQPDGVMAVTKKTASRANTRRQSIAIGVGISKDIETLKNLEAPVLSSKKSETNMSEMTMNMHNFSNGDKSPRTHTAFKYPSSKNTVSNNPNIQERRKRIGSESSNEHSEAVLQYQMEKPHSNSSDVGIIFTTRSESQEEEFMSKFAGRRGSVFSSQRSVLPSIPSNEALNEATLEDQQSKHLENMFQASNPMNLPDGVMAVTKKPASRANTRRQSIAIGVGISKDIEKLKNPEAPVLSSKTSETNLSEMSMKMHHVSDGVKAPRNHTPFKYPASNKTSSKSLNIQAGRKRTSSEDSQEQSEAVLQYPMAKQHSNLLVPGGDSYGRGRPNSAALDLTPRTMKKCQSAVELLTASEIMATNTPRSRKTSEGIKAQGGSLLERRDSFQKYTRNK